MSSYSPFIWVFCTLRTRGAHWAWPARARGVSPMWWTATPPSPGRMSCDTFFGALAPHARTGDELRRHQRSPPPVHWTQPLSGSRDTPSAYQWSETTGMMASGSVGLSMSRVPSPAGGSRGGGSGPCAAQGERRRGRCREGGQEDVSAGEVHASPHVETGLSEAGETGRGTAPAGQRSRVSRAAPLQVFGPTLPSAASRWVRLERLDRAFGGRPEDAVDAGRADAVSPDVTQEALDLLDVGASVAAVRVPGAAVVAAGDGGRGDPFVRGRGRSRRDGHGGSWLRRGGARRRGRRGRDRAGSWSCVRIPSGQRCSGTGGTRRCSGYRTPSDDGRTGAAVPSSGPTDLGGRGFVQHPLTRDFSIPERGAQERRSLGGRRRALSALFSHPYGVGRSWLGWWAERSRRGSMDGARIVDVLQGSCG